MSKKIDPINEIYEDLIGSINQLNADAPELLKQYDEIRKYIKDSYRKLELAQKQMVEDAGKTAEKATSDIEKKHNDALKNINKLYSRMEEATKEATEKIDTLSKLTAQISSIEDRIEKIKDSLELIENTIGEAVEIDYDEVTTLGALCEKYFNVINGPLEVHRRGWTWDYYYVVEEVGEEKAVGNIYKSGRIRESGVEKDLSQDKFSVYNRHYFDQ